ncbi:MAG: O-antigen ligase family protein [Patescibacteria group bacterium]|nr:O-antigen ligase family protein [Patescibacteria group bacterium]
MTTLKALLVTTTITSLIAVLEHFDISVTCSIISLINQEEINISNSCWANDVQSRVYSTFGQPNWLAAWLVAIMPISLYFYLKAKNIQTKLTHIALCLLFMSALLFTKSRSGIIAFVLISFFFWSYYLIKKSKTNLQGKIKNFAIYAIPIFAIALAIGTPWSPKLNDLLQNQDEITLEKPQDFVPALEKGGTESGDIRKIVWKGAYEIWKAYPIFGSGLETFAFSYYKFRPIEHNYTSEWEYLYNKAHNEYLNFLANTGIVGTLSYILLIIFMSVKILGLKSLKNFREINTFNLCLFSGFASILITNFFGFSVTTTNMLFFVIPALAYTKSNNFRNQLENSKELSTSQKVAILFVIAGCAFIFYKTANYWLANYYYQQGKNEIANTQYLSALKYLQKSVSISPNESIYWNELANANTLIAQVLSNEPEHKANARQFVDNAIEASKKAILLSPNDVNHLRTQALMYVKLAIYDNKYLLNAKDSLIKANSLSPTDPKIVYNLALAYLRANETESALEYIRKAIDLKTDYKDARYALALISIDLGYYETAKSELEYILKYIDPNNQEVERELESLKQLQN